MRRAATNELDRTGCDPKLASDEALIAAIAIGDQAAFAALYDRQSALAFNLARRLLDNHEAAEEVVQDVFLRLWRGAATFDATRGTARNWLLASVHHAAISRMRGRWAHERRAVPLDDGLLLLAPDDPPAVAETAERASWLRAGLATLPTTQRETIELHYFAGLSCPELAAWTTASLSTVKGRLWLARAHLRATLGPLAHVLD